MLDAASTAAGMACPVCRAGVLEQRVAAAGPLLCPSCSAATLEAVSKPIRRPDAMMRCPACRTGAVVGYLRSQMLVVPDPWARCDTCGADFDYHTVEDSLTLAELPQGAGHLSAQWIGQTRTRAEWAALASERADEYRCGACAAEFHACADGGLEWVARAGNPGLVPSEHRGQCRPRLAWAKIAHHLPLDAGSIACPACAAQFDEVVPGQLTLLGAPRDPFGTVAAHRGRTYPVTTWRGMGMGGALAGPGLVCPACTARLEEGGRGDEYTLVAHDPGRDPHGVGTRYGNTRLSARDWRRIAAGGVPAGEEQRLREVARREFWAAMLAGEVATSTAEDSYPGHKARDEKIVITFPAMRVRSLFGFAYPDDEGQVWLTTRQLLYQGERGHVTVSLRDTAGCEVLDMGQAADSIVEIHGRDGSTPFRFIMGHGPMQYDLEGLALQLRWDEQAFAELFEALRQKA
jgi:hypothetical protein